MNDQNNMEKEVAIKLFIKKKTNPPEKVENDSLPEGSSWHFYCNYCGHLSDIIPKKLITPILYETPSNICSICKELVKKGWMEEAQKSLKR